VPFNCKLLRALLAEETTVVAKLIIYDYLFKHITSNLLYISFSCAVLQSLFLKPLSGDGFVYVDPEGNDSVRSAGSSSSVASSKKIPSHRALGAPSNNPGADPEKGLPLEESFDNAPQAFVVRQRGWCMRLYVRFCHFTPMLFIAVLVLGFAWLCSFDRPLALAVRRFLL